MQSTESVIINVQPNAIRRQKQELRSKNCPENRKARCWRQNRSTGLMPGQRRSGFSLVFQHLTATIKAIGADVVAQVGFARGGLDGDARHGQGIVRTVHAALGGRLFVLLNGHDGSLRQKKTPRGSKLAQPQS
jgi:hypothetical protein